jgi:hypothetical protein
MGDRVTRVLAVLLGAAIVSQGCATFPAGPAGPAQPRTATDQAVLADYVQRLPPGTAVRVIPTRGRTLRGTLMRATGESLILQPRTRLPEAPVEIPLAGIVAVTPDAENLGGLGTAIAAGAAAGAGAALAIFFILVAVFSN